MVRVCPSAVLFCRKLCIGRCMTASIPPHAVRDGDSAEPRSVAGWWVWQLWVVVPVLVLLSALIAGWGVLHINQKTMVRQLSAQQASETELLARMVASKLEQSQKVLATVAEDTAPWMQDSRPTLEWLLKQGLPATRYFDSMVFTDNKRVFRLQLRADNDASTDEVEPAERDLLRRVMVDGKPQYSEPFKSAWGGPSVAFAMPMRGDDGVVRGALASVLRLQSQNLLPLSLAAQPNDSAQLVVMTTSGIVLSHSDPARILGPVASDSLLSQALQFWQSRDTEGGKVGVLTRWNAPHLISVAEIPSARWLVVRMASHDTLLSAINIGERMWWMLIAAIVGLALLSWLWLCWHTRRLRALNGKLTVLAPEAEEAAQASALSFLPVDELQRIHQHVNQLQSQNQVWLKQLRRHDMLAEGLLQHAPFHFLLLNKERISEVSQSLATLLGYSPGELVDQSIYKLELASGEFTAVWSRLTSHLRRFGVAETVMALRHHNGDSVSVVLTLVQIDGTEPGMAWCFVQPGPTAAAQVDVQKRDDLTQLADCHALQQQLTILLQADSDGSGKAPVLLYVNVDNMTAINALGGYAQGDAVLQHVAHQIQLLQPFQAFTARIEGDKFAVLLYGCNPDQAETLAQQLCEAVQHGLVEPYGRQVVLTVSIGLAIVGPAFSDAQKLLRAADMASYDAKRHGGGTTRWAETRVRASAAR